MRRKEDANEAGAFLLEGQERVPGDSSVTSSTSAMRSLEKKFEWVQNRLRQEAVPMPQGGRGWGAKDASGTAACAR